MDAYQRAPRLHWAGVAGALVAIATDVWYLVLIGNEDRGIPAEFREQVAGPFEPAVIVIAAAIAVAATGALVAPLIRKPRAARFVSMASVVVLFVVGVIGLGSIGLPLLIAAILGLISTISIVGESR